MASKEVHVYYATSHARELKKPDKLREKVEWWEGVTGEPLKGEVLAGGGVLIRSRSRLEGDTPKSGGE